MNVLILGSGGREHTFAWKIKQSSLCENLFVAPGNAGTSSIAQNLNLDIMDFDEVLDSIKEHAIDLLLVGPEAPLVGGISDYFRKHMPGLMVIGPSKGGAQLEGSKAFAKQFMRDQGIPTAAYIEVTRESIDLGYQYIDEHAGPYVLKADGLAAGKGVLIINGQQSAKDSLKEMLEGKFGEASSRVVIEEFLEGLEFSVFILTDGQYYSMLPVAKDYKRVGEGDSGLNTGGMGAVSPVPFIDNDMLVKVRKRIIMPTLAGLSSRNLNYTGFIFFGLINVGGEPYVIEYNCRMGDPETQVVIPRLQNDLLELFMALFEKDLYEIRLQLDDRTATTVVLVSDGYPGPYEKGKVITGMDQIEDSLVFHAGTTSSDGEIVTNGGRVLALTSFGDDIRSALGISLRNAENISYTGKYYRKDIGLDLV